MNTNRPPFLRRYRGRAQAAPVQAGVARIIGALTPDGMGDIPITGSSIISGNSSGHFKVVGGAIVANSTGTSAGFNAGPYTLTTDNGQVFNITMVPNAYSIGKQDDFFTGSPFLGVGQLQYYSVSLNGKRVIGRPGLSCLSGIDNGFGSPLRNTSFGDVGTGWVGVSLESEDYTNPWVFTDTLVDITARYLQFKGIQFTVPPTGDNSANTIVLDGSATFPVSDIVFDSCVWLARPRTPIRVSTQRGAAQRLATVAGSATTAMCGLPTSASSAVHSCIATAEPCFRPALRWTPARGTSCRSRSTLQATVSYTPTSVPSKSPRSRTKMPPRPLRTTSAPASLEGQPI
jgi:hypothetical protein